MYFTDLTSFVFILISVTGQINSQDSIHGTCHVWADPHLVMFPVNPGQANLRMSYYCQTPGRMLILKNAYIEVSVNITGAPFWNEDFEITLFANYQPFCTISQAQPTCNSPHVDIVQIGPALEILYFDADNLSLTINSYMVNNHSVYDIMITQSYRLILDSSGLCVTKSPSCRLENAVNPLGRRRRQTANNSNITKICDEYMKQAYHTASKVVGNIGSSMTEHARIACIKDVTISGNPAWARSAINFVTMDALQQAPLKPVERHALIKTIVPAMKDALLRAEENSYHWMYPNSSYIILT